VEPGRGTVQTAAVGRLLRSADFERVLGTRPASRSAHFAMHFVASQPSLPKKPVVQELSTGGAPNVTKPVDDFPAPSACWLGLVVPKRHARRAVTRNLLKRQIREAVGRHVASLANGLWVVRLRAPFDSRQFRSAASDALRVAARAELEGMLTHACRAARPA
jgi:ribonuclease P protein component